MDKYIVTLHLLFYKLPGRIEKALDILFWTIGYQNAEMLDFLWKFYLFLSHDGDNCSNAIIFQLLMIRSKD